MAAVPSIGRANRVQPAAAPEADLTRALYETYANQIFRYCLHQLGSREEAEDAVQSTFLNAFRGIKRGIVPELESAWLFKIAHNVCLSRRRTTWRRDRIESPADFDLVEELAPAPARHADELIGLQDVLEEMPENQRRAILLREWQGLSYHEIAEELELSQAAVETLIFRARRSLARGLEQPAELKKRRLVRGADWANVLGGLKSLLLGSSVAVKVAAAVAVVSATTVVAAAPAQKHSPAQQKTPAVPASSAPTSVVSSTSSAPVAPPSHPEHGLTASPVQSLVVPAADPGTTPPVDTPSVTPSVVELPPPAAPTPDATPASTAGSSEPSTPAAKTQDSSPSVTAPGQTKKSDASSGSNTSGSSNSGSSSSTAPGQVKKQQDPAPAVTPTDNSSPPGQAKKPDSSPSSSDSNGGQSGNAPGQTKSSDSTPQDGLPQPNPALNSKLSGSTGATPAAVQDAANQQRANGNGNGNGNSSGNSGSSGNANAGDSGNGKGKGK